MRPQLYPISIDKKPAKLPYIPCVRECVVTDLTKGFLWYIYYYTILRCVLAISPPGKFVSSRKQQLVKQRFTVHGYRVKMGLVRSGGTANPVCCTDHLVCGSGVPKLSVPRSCTCTDGHAWTETDMASITVHPTQTNVVTYHDIAVVQCQSV